MTCDQCGMENTGEGSFCSRCGNSLGWICECAYVNRADAMFCGGCGRAVSSHNQPKEKSPSKSNVPFPSGGKFDIPNSQTQGRDDSLQRQPETPQSYGDQPKSSFSQNTSLDDFFQRQSGSPQSVGYPPNSQTTKKEKHDEYSQADSGPLYPLNKQQSISHSNDDQLPGSPPNNHNISRAIDDQDDAFSSKLIQNKESHLSNARPSPSYENLNNPPQQQDTMFRGPSSQGLSMESSTSDKRDSFLSKSEPVGESSIRVKKSLLPLVEQLTESQIENLLEESYALKLVEKEEISQEEINRFFENQ
jgi:hypothetical protein